MKTLVAGVLLCFSVGATADTKNVILIMADDMRALEPHVHAPNLRKLASQGVTLERMYTPVAACQPARAAIMSGLRPDTSGVKSNPGVDGGSLEGQPLREASTPNVRTLPQHFAAKGYKTASICKSFHNPSGSPDMNNAPNNRKTWDYRFTVGGPFPTNANDSGKRYLYKEMPGEETAFGEWKCAENAIGKINEWKNDRFFMTIGFWTPHVPWVPPSKYFSLYDVAAIPLKTPRSRGAGIPVAAHNSGGILTGDTYSWDKPSGYVNGSVLSDALARKLSLSFYSTLSFMDAQVGRVLKAVDEAGIANNTVVMFVPDQGFHLGEHANWGKFTNFEYSVRTPTIVRGPGIPADETRYSVSEIIDVYPTLVDLAGVDLPLVGEHESGGVGLEGRSLKAVIDGTGSDRTIHGALSQVRTGYSLRTHAYRYEQWGSTPDHVLYDHTADPNGYTEATNVWSSASAGLKSDLQEAMAAIKGSGKKKVALPDSLKSPAE